MSNVICILLVFIIGFGWGAAAMYLPVYKKWQEVLALALNCVKLLENVAEGQEKATTILKSVSRNNLNIIESTQNVIESIDKLIEEIGNEI